MQTTTNHNPIVCVGFPRWEGGNYLKSTVQLMTELARTHRVLYVDYPFTYKDVWHARRGQAPDVPLAALTNNEARLQTRQLTSGGSLHLLRLPPFLPANFLRLPALYDQIMQWNGRRALRAIRGALDELGWTAPIVINAFNPALGNQLAGQLSETQLVYYCYDEIGAAPWIGRHGARHEREFLSRVDLTIVSSTGLYAAKAPHTRECAIVRNGVDLKLFRPGGARPQDLPSGPVIGYIGSVDHRLDGALLEEVARMNPRVDLVFVGRIMDMALAARLRALPNVHLLGPRPPHDLGRYVEAFDVGLIPFVHNDLTAGIYPLKINEYLALGVPVVSTDFADLSDFREVARIASSATDFVAGVQEALHDHGRGTIHSRREFAAGQTWTRRATDFAHLLAFDHENATA